MIDFKDELKKLCQLQELDGQIYDKKRELAAQPKKIAQLRQAFEAGQDELNVLKKELTRIQVERKNKETDLAGKEEHIKKYQGQQVQVKSNKEYSALQHEIDTLKADNSMLEEEVIRLLDETDRVNKLLDEEKERCAVKEKKVKEQEAVFQGEAVKIREGLRTLEAQRSQLSPKVDSRSLASYEKILKRSEGTAVVAVHDSSCGGCNTSLPPQVINEVKLGRTLIFCERCTRILYCED